MIEALLAMSLAASAASLPGIGLDFDVDANGRWVLPAQLPDAFAQAGVQPGWTLAAVDGLKLGADPLAAERIVAEGPSRDVRLHFDTPEGETIVVVPRGPLVVAEEVGLLPWPDGFTPVPRGWQATGDGVPRLVDGDGAIWVLDQASGAQTRAKTGQESAEPLVIPEIWWALSDATWVVDGTSAVRSGDRAWAAGELAGAARLGSFQGSPGDHLAVPGDGGLAIWAVTWPKGTPELPFCVPDVPETCLVAGRQVRAQLLERPGGRAEALRALGVACDGGTFRACLEAVALDDSRLAGPAEACGERDVNACHDLARERLRAEPESPSPLLLGVLEYACAVDASGSLGERLRRLEDVGEGCMLLSAAFDRAAVPDRALLSLDQACVLGRADACDEAARRRKEAFALKTVSECEAPTLPLGSACVQLGRLLQDGPIEATQLDDFSAFLRACDLGEEEGCVLLGDYVDRWGIDNQRVVQAERTLLESCDTGEQRACVGAAHLLVRHEPRSDEYGQALELFTSACKQGMPTACIAGAEQRRIGAARRVDAPEPDRMWQDACDQDSPPGCAGLGERLSRSKRSWDAAFSAWTKACDTGEAGACTDLGRFVENRHEPWPGEQPAPAYLRRGCDNGDAEGCYWQASADVPKKGDPPESAYLLLERSCDGQYGKACAELARVHLERESNFDDEIAAGHLQQACDYGNYISCKDLGQMYMRGKGVEKDRLKARELAQRYSVNAERHHVRLGPRIGFPSVAGGEAELVVPIPVGPTIALAGSYSYLPSLGGIMHQVVGEGRPQNPPDLQYIDAGVRLYPNNKGRGIYGMVAVHRIDAPGSTLDRDLTREGVSARFGMYSETKRIYTRVEMGLGQYGMIHLADFDEDETDSFPLLLTTIGVSVGVALF